MAGVVPCVEVSHLPSSTSFFSAVLHPLGLEYINTVRHDPASVVSFGAGGDPLLQIRQTPAPRLSSLVLTAPSRLAVIRFRECGLRSNPPLFPASQYRDLREQGEGNCDGAVLRAALLDLDGNRIEVVYPALNLPRDILHPNGSPVRKAHSTTEVGRVLEWNYNTSSAASTTAALRSSGAAPNLSDAQVLPGSRLSGAATQLTMSASPRQSASSNSSSSSSSSPGGISASTVVGALLGVAAGAALTYGIVSRDKTRAPRQEFDCQVRRPLPRRETYPERLPSDDSRSVYKRDHHDKSTAFLDQAPRRLALSYPNKGDLGLDHYVYDYNRNDRDDIAPQRYLTQGTRQPVARQSVAIKSPARSSNAREVTANIHDARSHLSIHADSPRSRSEAPLEGGPLSAAGLEKQGRAYAQSRHSGAAKSFYSTSSRPRDPVYEAGPSTYVSARTHGTSTPRGPSYPLPEHEVPFGTQPSRGSRVPAAKLQSRRASTCLSARQIPLPASQAPSQVSARQVPLPPSQAPSSVSARDIPLPASSVGSFANWNDDLESVVPSDSISCVGSKAAGRRRRETHC